MSAFRHQSFLQRGMTLLELLATLAVSSLLLAGLSYLTQQWMTSVRMSNTAAWHKTLNAAASAYIKDNYAALQAIASPTVPAAISIANLQAGNYLSASFSTTSPIGQTGCVLVLEPVANRLEALVVGEGGTALSEFDAGPVASEIGAAGGFIFDAATARGAYGGWSLGIGNFVAGNCSGTAATTGSVASALWFNDGQLITDYLYRNQVPGRPDLNTMNTPILLSASTVQTVGTACPTNGALARNTDGAIVSCQLGVWKTQGSAYWQDPVATFATLPTCDAAASWQTRIVQAPNGAVAGNAGPRAYTCNGSSWQPLALDNDGNLTVPGTATLDKLAGDLEVTVVAVRNTACSPNGRIAREADGSFLTCKLGLWQSAGGSGLGVGQTWQSVSRSFGVTYVNNTGKPIMVNVYVAGNSQNGHSFYVNGQLVTAVTTWGAYSGETMSVVVPDGASYVAYGFWLYGWYELR